LILGKAILVSNASLLIIFMYYLTLFFLKLFSSLPHSTCSLSISCQYLALDEIYHPFWTVFPNNPTLWKCITELERIAKHGILTFYDVPFQGTLTTPLNRKHTFKLQFIRVEPWRFQIWALPASFDITKGILFNFFFLRLLICLSSAGTLIRFKIITLLIITN